MVLGAALAMSTSAASGSTRPIDVSRSRAMSSRAYQSSRTMATERRERRVFMPDVRRQGSTRSVGAQVSSEVNSWRAHSDLPWAARSTPIRLRSSVSTSTSRAA